MKTTVSKNVKAKAFRLKSHHQWYRCYIIFNNSFWVIDKCIHEREICSRDDNIKICHILDNKGVINPWLILKFSHHKKLVVNDLFSIDMRFIYKHNDSYKSYIISVRLINYYAIQICYQGKFFTGEK